MKRNIGEAENSCEGFWALLVSCPGRGSKTSQTYTVYSFYFWGQMKAEGEENVQTEASSIKHHLIKYLLML